MITRSKPVAVVGPGRRIPTVKCKGILTIGCNENAGFAGLSARFTPARENACDIVQRDIQTSKPSSTWRPSASCSNGSPRGKTSQTPSYGPRQRRPWLKYRSHFCLRFAPVSDLEREPSGHRAKPRLYPASLLAVVVSSSGRNAGENAAGIGACTTQRRLFVMSQLKDLAREQNQRHRRR